MCIVKIKWTPSDSYVWENHEFATIRGIIQMQSDIKINRLLLDACEELLPKTSEADNKKIKEILNLVRAKLTDE